MTSSASTSRSRAEVAFLVPDLGRSGGMAVVRRYAARLLEEGMGCRLVVCAPKPGPLPADDGSIPVVAADALRGEPVDVAIATWWTTADWLFEIEAARRIAFLQSFEQRFYRDHERADRLGAMAVLDLPVDFIVIGSHMQRLLERLRPDARCQVVPNGIDKDVFAARGGEPAADGPLRVLVEGQPTLWFKGVQAAVAAVRAAREPVRLTLAVHDPGSVAIEGADQVVGGLEPEGMAALYAEHDVLLKLSRFEGLGLPPLEAMHVGVPSILTPFTGSDDYARHGDNALIVGFDDHPGTVAAIELLARDRELRERLSAGALATAARWPDARSSAAAFADAVRRVLKAPPPQPDAALRRAARTRRLGVELGREHQRRDDVTVDHAVRNAEHFEAEFDAHRALAEERLAMLHDLTSRPSYRAAHLAKRLVGRRSEW